MKGAKEVRVDYPQEIVHRVGRLNPVPAQHRYWQQQHMPSKLGENLSPIFNYSALPIVLTLSYIPLLSHASTSAVLQDTRMPV